MHSPETFTQFVRDVYATLCNNRPDLIHLIYPLMEWAYDEPDENLCSAAKACADASLSAGQLDITTTAARFNVDLLGILLSMLKSSSATSANAQVYTPNPIAYLMARIEVPDEGARILDPAVGSGGLFLGAAQAMREQGRDPATVTWAGADIDNLAIAACAINSVLWELGPHLLLAVADTLAEGDWPSRAAAQRDEVLRLAETIRRDKAMLDAVRTAQRLTETAAGDNACSGSESSTTP